MSGGDPRDTRLGRLTSPAAAADRILREHPNVLNICSGNPRASHSPYTRIWPFGPDPGGGLPTKPRPRATSTGHARPGSSPSVPLQAGRVATPPPLPYRWHRHTPSHRRRPRQRVCSRDAGGRGRGGRRALDRSCLRRQRRARARRARACRGALECCRPPWPYPAGAASPGAPVSPPPPLRLLVSRPTQARAPAAGAAAGAPAEPAVPTPRRPGAVPSPGHARFPPFPPRPPARPGLSTPLASPSPASRPRPVP